jgi:hypothetical protein
MFLKLKKDNKSQSGIRVDSSTSSTSCDEVILERNESESEGSKTPILDIQVDDMDEVMDAEAGEPPTKKKKLDPDIKFLKEIR